MNVRPVDELIRVLILPIVVLSLSGVPLLAQTDSACTWDRCALRTAPGFFGGQLVRGVNDEKVASIGWFPPALPFLAERSDSAARFYSAFRAKQSRGVALALAGFGTVFIGTIIAASNDNAIGPVLIGGAIAVSIVGAISIGSGQNDLSRSVWWYNRTLPHDLPSNRPMEADGRGR